MMQLKDEEIQRIIDLISKRLGGELTSDEQAVLERWVGESDENRVLYEELNDPAYRNGQLQEMAGYGDVETALQSFLKKRERGLKIHRNHFIKRVLEAASRSKIGTTLIAAAALAAIVFGVWFFNSNSGVLKQVQDDVVQNDIAPGKNTATLTLPNGKTITLSDAKTGVVIGDDKLSYNDGTDLSARHPELVSGSRPGYATMLTAATPRGGTYQVVLPDGTKVWLNADTKISFPSQFNGKERRIVLEGEAYFEVSKVYAPLGASARSSSRERATSSSRASVATRDLIPFIVKTKQQEVEVLGTRFNINSYTDEVATTTTLIEGSVRVNAFNSATSRATAILKPNQQSIANSEGMQVLNTDASAALDWKNGEFVFNNEAITSILRRVSRWYNVEIVYQTNTDRPLTFTGSVSRFDKVSSVLKMLEKTSDLHFEIKERKIIVK